jgi:fibronectin-binding autotransporter adhesin
LLLQTSINPAIGGIAASAALTQSIIGTVVNRPTSPFVSGLAAEETCSHGGYLRTSVGRAAVTGTSVNNGVSDETEIDSKFYGAQGGYDLGCYDGRFFNGFDGAIGVMAGFNNGSTSQGIFSAPNNPQTLTGISGSKFKQTFAGLYLAGSKDRFSGDLQVRFDKTKFTLSETPFAGFSAIGLDGLEFQTKSTTAGARLNYRFDVNEEKGINFIPTIGFNYTSVTGYALGLNGGTTGPGQTGDDAVLTISPYNTVVGFLGGTLTRTKISESGDAATTGFVSGNYYQDFGGDREATYQLGAQPIEAITVGSIGGFAEASIGLNYVKILDKGPGGAKQLNANIRADARFGANVSNSYSLTAQIRYSF